MNNITGGSYIMNKKLTTRIITTVMIIFILGGFFSPTHSDAAWAGYWKNISLNPVTEGAKDDGITSTLPPSIKSLVRGKNYCFNLNYTSDIKVRKTVLYVYKGSNLYTTKTRDAGDGYYYTASYACEKLTFNEVGNYSYFWVITSSNNSVQTLSTSEFFVYEPELEGSVSLSTKGTQTVVADTSKLISDGNSMYTYDWQIGDEVFSTTSAEYQVKESDKNKNIFVTVFASNYTGSKTSETRVIGEFEQENIRIVRKGKKLEVLGGNSSGNIKWTSKNKKIVSVSKNGTFKIKKTGKKVKVATLTAKKDGGVLYNSISLEYKIAVLPPYQTALYLLQNDLWDKQSNKNRLLILQLIEKENAKRQGRRTIKLSFDKKMKSVGRYSSPPEKIKIALKSIKEDGAIENLDTVLHEGRHAYQSWAIAGKIRHNNKAEVRAWRKNKENYISSKNDYKAYLKQPVERDARSYATKTTKKMLREQKKLLKKIEKASYVNLKYSLK